MSIEAQNVLLFGLNYLNVYFFLEGKLVGQNRPRVILRTILKFTDIRDACPVYRFQNAANSLLCFKYSYISVK